MEELTFATVLLRLALAALMGGLIGVERGRKRRPAGMRTHMLVCIGATLVMLTSQYMMVYYPLADPARMGAQVISGIGFLGAGTIIVTRHNQVIGLTTAAGLWASACMGLALGVGFYTGAIVTGVFILLIVLLLHKLDSFVMSHSRVVDLFVEFASPSDMSELFERLRSEDIRVGDVEMIRSRDVSQHSIAALITIRLPDSREHTEVLQMIEDLDCTQFVEEV